MSDINWIKTEMPNDWWVPHMSGQTCCMAHYVNGEKVELRKFDGTASDSLGKSVWKKEYKGH